MTEKLDYYLSTWELTTPQLIAETPTSQVYTVKYHGDTIVLKLLTPIGVDDEQNGAIALTCFDGQGAVRLLDHDAGAHLLEYVDGDDLLPMVLNGDDTQATKIIAGVVNQLHSATPTLNGLTTLRRRFRSLFRKAEIDSQAGINSIYVRGARVANILLDSPRDERVLHGDIHHENIRHHQTRGWLAYDPKGLYGERTFDVANALCNPMRFPAIVHDETRLLENAQILAQELAIELARILAFTYAYACLSASWSLEGHGDVRLSLKVAKIIEPHLDLF